MKIVTMIRKSDLEIRYFLISHVVSCLFMGYDFIPNTFEDWGQVSCQI